MYETFFQQQLQLLRSAGRYRVFADLERHLDQAPWAKWNSPEGLQRVVVWCSNDYLGMSQHPKVLTEAIKATKSFGVGSGGTRNISGTAHLHVELEKSVAKLHQKEAGLIFTSGYVANEATLCTLAKNLPECVVFCDQKNHASMIQGVRHSGAQKHIFSHNNLQELERQLACYDYNTPKIIAFVSVYSMEGDFAPIEKICDLAEKYNALTYLDEVHAVGIYGKGGAGLADETHQMARVDIIQGNFAKAYGVVGGYIASTTNLVDFVRSFASGFIFTTSLPPAIACAALTSIEILKESDERRKLLFERVGYLKQLLSQTEITYQNTPSHIVPIVVGNAALCKQMSDELLKNYGIYVQPINYPTVPVGQERFRVTVTPLHTPKMIEELVKALKNSWKKHKLKAVA